MFISNCVDAFLLYYIVADTKYIHIYTYYLLVKKYLINHLWQIKQNYK